MEYYSFYFDLLFSKTRQYLRCNLLFDLIGHFGLLKDVNISFFLSSSSICLCNPHMFVCIAMQIHLGMFYSLKTLLYFDWLHS